MEHIPGETNCQADKISRWVDPNDYQLHPDIFREVVRAHKPCPSVDGFASARNHLLPRYYSLLREPGCSGVNFFSQNLNREVCWLNPPFNLLLKVLVHLRKHKAKAVILTPLWYTAPWWALVTEMRTAPTLLLPRLDNTFRPGSTRNLVGIGPPNWECGVTWVSGDLRDQREARERWGQNLAHLDRSVAEQFGRSGNARAHDVPRTEDWWGGMTHLPRSHEAPF